MSRDVVMKHCPIEIILNSAVYVKPLVLILNVIQKQNVPTNFIWAESLAFLEGK